MKNELLRHLLSTIAYRFGLSVRNAKSDFGDFNAGNESRSPSELVYHMRQVLSYTNRILSEENSNEEQPQNVTLDSEIKRFIEELKSIDAILEEKEIDIEFSKKLIQGPLSDVLTHVGQIALLSRLHDNPVAGENFYKANIETGIK